MLLLLNKYSGGNTALKKWKRINCDIFSKYPAVNILQNYHIKNIYRIINTELINGERFFIAAGGDGTVNLLLNILMSPENSKYLNEINFGAIGLGSSNDFHKPFLNYINGIPVKIDFDNTVKYDIGVVESNTNNGVLRKYWIINSSIGLTADANNFFNNPDRILNALKRISTNIAILYTILLTILRYKNKDLNITIGNYPSLCISLTNVGVMKNPNFSGNLSYDWIYHPDNGYFDVHTCECHSGFSVFNILKSLSSNKCLNSKLLTSYKSDSVNIESKEPFFVEFDGEIIKTNQAKFSIIPKSISVCKH